jgi:hypothetical protein
MRFVPGNEPTKKNSPSAENTGAESKPLVQAFKAGSQPIPPPPAVEPPPLSVEDKPLVPAPKAPVVPEPSPLHKQAPAPSKSTGSTGNLALPPMERRLAPSPAATNPNGSSLQGSRSSFSKPTDSEEKKQIPKASQVNAVRFGGLANGGAHGSQSAAPLSKQDIQAALSGPPSSMPPEFRGGPEVMETIYEEVIEDPITDAKIVAARHLLKQCREAGLIAIEEAVKLVPKAEELETNISQLQLISRKIGAQSPAALQKAICSSMGIPIMPIRLFPTYRKNVPSAVADMLRAHNMIVLDMEHTHLDDGRRHGHITIGAEHPFYEDFILEVCRSNKLDVLFAFTVVIDINDLLTINPSDIAS